MLDPTTLTSFMAALGYGAYIPVALAIVGLFSAIATVYPATAPGAKIVHTIALLIGKASPAVPASNTTTETK